VVNRKSGPSAVSAAVAVSSFVVEAGGSAFAAPRDQSFAPVSASTTSPTRWEFWATVRDADARKSARPVAAGSGAVEFSGARTGPRVGGLDGCGEAEVDGDGDGVEEAAGEEVLPCRSTTYPPTTATVTAVAAARVTAREVRTSRDTTWCP
jgi:hypothetical protein